ncbi:unnamed protein product [Bathycoccus prasinos]
MKEANADEEEEDQGGGGENEEEEEEDEESIVSETKTEEEVVIKKDPPFWHLSFCSDAEIRNLQHRDETNNGDFEKEKDEMIGNEPLFQTLADLMVMALSLQEVVRQLEFFEGENMSECTTQPRITLADVLEICDEAVQVGYRQAKAHALRRTNYEANKQPDMYPIYKQIWHKPDFNDPFHVVIVDTKRIKGKDVFKVLTERTKTQRHCRERNKVCKKVFYWRGGVPQFVKREELKTFEAKQNARSKLDPTGETPPVESVFEDETTLARALTRIENDPRVSVPVSREESKAELMRSMYLEEHERWWNDMLSHALTRFDVYVTQAKYNDLLQLKYKKTKDGRDILIVPKKKGFFSRSCDMCVVM